MENIYECEVFSRLQDHSMHPGGLRLTDRALRLAELTNGMAVADVGCGAGATAAYLAGRYGFKMIGLDISEQLIRIGLKRSPDLRFIRWDCETLPFEPESLDAILFECALSVIGCSGKTLDECVKALKKNGTLIISDLFTKPAGAGMASGLPTPSKFEKRLEKNGFRIAVSEDHTPALVTYAAELKGRLEKTCSTGQFLSSQFGNGFKLSDYCYYLIIARKDIKARI